MVRETAGQLVHDEGNVTSGVHAHAVWRQRRNLPRKLAVLKATTEPIWAVRWRRRPRRQLDDVCGRGNRRRWPAATSSY